MRPGQQNKRGRGRNNNNSGNGGGNFNRKGANPLTRTYDSSGPDVKIRGTAQHIAEKYATLARDAQSAGDRVMAENYLQHAEHYNRIIAAAQAQMQERFQRDDRNEFNDRDNDDIDATDEQPVSHSQPAPQPEIAGSGPQPVIEEMPAEAAAAAAESAADGAAASGERAPRRRSAGNRPRRQPRRTAASGEAGEADEQEDKERQPKPELVAVASE